MTRPTPPSRRDQQQQTREALVTAARAVFSEVGFHRASLDQIANEAGYSKGAVYSNFDSKAALFLAVMDQNIAAVVEQLDNQGDGEAAGDAGFGEVLEGHPEFDEAIRGFALATLEFIATAARDEHLSAESGKRVALLVAGYAAMADGLSSEPDDDLSPTERGALLTALDQGSALLSLTGVDVITERVLETGMHRLLSGTDSSRPAAKDDGSQDRPAFHYREVRARIAEGIGRAALEQEAGRPTEPGA